LIIVSISPIIFPGTFGGYHPKTILTGLPPTGRGLHFDSGGVQFKGHSAFSWRRGWPCPLNAACSVTARLLPFPLLGHSPGMKLIDPQ
jgi:hypothetical protein